MVLKRIGKSLEGDDNRNRLLAFQTDPAMSKPEIKQYLEKIYGLEIETVNTLIRMGKIKYEDQMRKSCFRRES